MDMVGRSSDANDLTSCCIHQLAYVGMNTFNVFFVYLWTVCLYVKNNMKIYLTKRLCHKYNAFALSGRRQPTASFYPG